MKDQQFLEPIAEGISAWLVGLFERLLGSSMRLGVMGGMTVGDLLTSLCFVVATWLGVTIIDWLVRRFLVRRVGEPRTREWRWKFMETLGKPLRLFLWVCGLYLVITPLLLHLEPARLAQSLQQFLVRVFDIGVFICVIWFFYRFTRVVEAGLNAWSAQSKSKVDDLLIPLLGKSIRILVPVLAVILALPLIGLPPAYSGLVNKVSSMLIIGTVAWILFQAVATAEKLVLSEYDITQADNLQARKVYTQVHVLSKTLYFIIGVFTVASVLMMFEEVRRLGASILASAGVIGIIVGFAAQRTIANLFAGFQLAMAQPIRLDDVVIVENEWGRIEEITLTYVVVRIWDERRLIVPLSYFIEKPFQNWTRVSAELLGAVHVYVDYSLPLAEVRKAVQRIVESSPLWDRRFWNLQVTEATERSMQVRILATASDSSKAWDLRCEIRERLIEFIQNQFAQSLPKVRAQWETSPAGTRPELRP